MEDEQWDIKEVRRLKKFQLVQNNFLFLLVFLMLGYFVKIGMSALILVGGCILGWIVTASLVYTLITGKAIGSKRYRRLQRFERYQLGDKRWRRRGIAEIVIVIILSTIITVFVLNVDTHSLSLDLTFGAFSFIGAWLGHNIGEIYRLKKLKDQGDY